jgi:Putative zinc-binding metallo-peptidase
MYNGKIIIKLKFILIAIICSALIVILGAFIYIFTDSSEKSQELSVQSNTGSSSISVISSSSQQISQSVSSISDINSISSSQTLSNSSSQNNVNNKSLEKVQKQTSQTSKSLKSSQLATSLVGNSNNSQVAVLNKTTPASTNTSTNYVWNNAITVQIGNGSDDEYAKKYFSWTVKNTKIEDVIAINNIVSSELNRTSPAFITRSKLTKLLFVHNLKLLGATICGTVDHVHHYAYYNIDCLATKEYFLSAFHHELFHLLDYLHFLNQDDQSWKSLNKPEFRYKGSGRDALNSTEYNNNANKDFEGFATHYSQYAAEEDRADIYAMYMIPDTNLGKKFINRLAGDAILRNKLDYIKKMI